MSAKNPKQNNDFVVWKTKVQVMVDNICIGMVYENTFLGETLDHKICLKLHVSLVKATEYQSVGEEEGTF